MDMVPSAVPVSSVALWTGRVLSALPALALIASGAMKIVQPAGFADDVEKMGWQASTMVGIGIVEIACALLYALPPTAVLGAILMTGYLGGAIATHVRLVQLPEIAPAIILGVMVWLGLWLRDRRVRALAPFRR